MAEVKVLVCGSVDSQHRRLFQRVTSVHDKSGPFDFMLCCGSFPGRDTAGEWPRFLADGRSVPLPVYVLGDGGLSVGGTNTSSGGGELCPNVVALGRRGVFTSSGGVRVAYLAPAIGVPVSAGDVAVLEASVTAAGAGGVDIFITSCWPRGVTRLATNPDGVYTEETGSPLVSRLLFSLRPRYVFTGGLQLHYERLPYRNHAVLQQQQCHVTRFISLARAFNSLKRKWLYALSLCPMDRMSRMELIAQPADATACPFDAAEMTSVLVSSSSSSSSRDAPSQYFYSTDKRQSSDRRNGSPKKRKRQDPSSAAQQQQQQQQQQLGAGVVAVQHHHHQQQQHHHQHQQHHQQACWFCLSSPHVEKHLVVYVGQLCYVALAKGGLLPDHILVLPVEHVRCWAEAGDALLAEMSDCQRRLTAVFERSDQRPVFFERNYRQTHAQLQCVPVPSALASRRPPLAELLAGQCASYGVRLHELPPLAELRQAVRPGEQYFYVALPDGRRLFSTVDGGAQFPLNLGRAMLAAPGLLDCLDRVDWTKCVLDTQQETQLTQHFKSRFKEVQ